MQRHRHKQRDALRCGFFSPAQTHLPRASPPERQLNSASRSPGRPFRGTGQKPSQDRWASYPHGSSLEPAGTPGRSWRSSLSLFPGKGGCVTARVLRTRCGPGVHPSGRSLRALGAVETKAITRSRCRHTPRLPSTPTARRAACSLPRASSMQAPISR